MPKKGYNKGKNNPNYGKFDEKSSGWKGDDAGYHVIHIRIKCTI